MLYRLVALGLLSAACGGQPTTASAPARASVPAGDPAGVSRRKADQAEVQVCDAGCMQARRDRCAEGGTTWQLGLELGGKQVGNLHVSDAGLIRFDGFGKRLVGIDAHLWQACMPSCPGEGEPACVPYAFDLDLGADADCAPTLAAGPSWHGHATQQVTFACAKVSMSLTVVPALRPVRDALVEVGVITADDGLANLDGLAVEMVVDGAVIFALGEVAEASCAAFDDPPGYRRSDALADYEALLAIEPELLRTFQLAGQALSERALAQAQQQAGPEILAAVGELCLGKQDRYEPAEVQACLQAHPELAEAANLKLTALIQPMVEQIVAATGEVEQLLAIHIDQPLCEHFAAR